MCSNRRGDSDVVCEVDAVSHSGIAASGHTETFVDNSLNGVCVRAMIEPFHEYVREFRTVDLAFEEYQDHWRSRSRRAR